MGNSWGQSNHSDSNPVSISSASSRQQAPHSTHSDRSQPYTPTELPVASPTSPISPEPPTASPPSHPSPPQPSPPPLISVPKVDLVTNLTSTVPSTEYAILDFLPDSNSPENKAYRVLLSDDASRNSIALYGMGGVGKTTILCALGSNDEIKSKFRDGVWFFRLGHDITMPSFILQLQRLVKRVLPDFLENFKELAASEHLYHQMVTELTNLLEQKRFLLLFDDVWDINPCVFKVVCAMCKAVRGNKRTSMRVLSSTRNRNIADSVALNSCIPINPEAYDTSKCREIFCSRAGISASDIPSLSAQNQIALGHILETCGGLPLALSVAGSGVKELMDPNSDHCDHNAISEYWGLLEPNTGQLAEAEMGDGHIGLASALKTSVQFVEKKWESKKKTAKLGDQLGAGEMFASLCIMQKQMCLPVSAIQKLWGLNEVQAGVRMLSRNSLVSEVRDGSKIVGVRVHDLVLNMSMEMAESGGGTTKWHVQLLDGYRASLNISRGAKVNDEGAEWWNLDNSDKYIVNNVVRHLLGARQVSEALGLLVDYRWVERMNDDKNRTPFQKVISELKLLKMNLMEHEKTETARKITRDIEVLINVMGLCMVPYCMKNREECTFQLYGRLRDVRSESGIVERLVCSIGRNGRRPWARVGPGVLTSGRSLLRRVLCPEYSVVCMCVGVGGNEVVVGEYGGEVWVYNGWNGSKKMPLVGHGEEDVIDMYFDRSSRMIYSCSSRGRVMVWKEYKMFHSVQAESVQEDERTLCMQVLPTRGEVILGTSEGRLVVIDVESGSTIRTVDAHVDMVSSLAAGQREDVVVSGSMDRMVRVWDAENIGDTEIAFVGHEARVNSVALSRDGRLLASGSNDRTVRIFDLERRGQLWSSSDEPHGVVTCVLFSRDAGLLYSAGWNCGICVWRLSNGGRDVSLVHTLRHSTIGYIKSLYIGDDSELFSLDRHRIQVWEARDVDSRCDRDNAFLPDVHGFVLSADEASILTWNERSKCLEIRDVLDVSKNIDRVVSSVAISNLSKFFPRIFSLSNDRKYVSVAESRWTVRVYDASKGILLHTLSDVQQLAFSSSSHRHGKPTRDRRANASTDWVRDEPNARIGSLWFSEDGSTASAMAEVGISGEDGERTWIKSKPISWNVSSGAVLSESHVEGETNASYSNAGSGTNCEEQYPALSVDWYGVVRCEHEGNCFTIATLEDRVSCWHYCSNTSRLWFAKYRGGIFFIDLMTDNNQLQSRVDPPLGVAPVPPFPQPHSPPSHNVNEDTEEEYDVFISHAGPDKHTIAKPLYDLLVALGLKVFLDMAELRPGQHAPQKMILAMRTAKIAVVILSPEFAARKWTMKELMCFLERFGVDGERGMLIIPVFYRLKLDECRDANSLFSMVDENGHSVFITEGFLQRMAQENEYQIRDVVKALQSMRSLTGIENSDGVTNGKSVKDKEKQNVFVKRIAKAIVEGKKRLESGGAAGPSG